MILDAFYAHPMYFIGVVFAAIGAMGFGLFISGFFPGLPHFFTLSSHDEHQEHYRIRCVRGTMILVHIFILWEIVRLVASWFTGGSVDPSIVLGLIITYIIVMIIIGVWSGIASAIANKH